MFVARAAKGAPSKQRMYLNTAYTPTTSIAQLTNMSADASFPATTLSSGQIVIDRAGTINITASMSVTADSFSATETGYIYLNGSSIFSASRSNTGSITLNVSAVAVNAGDRIDIRSMTSYASGNTIGSGATSTFVEIDPA